MPKITFIFTCNTQKLVPLITSGNITAIKEKYVVNFCEKQTHNFPPNCFHIGKITDTSLDDTPVLKSLNISDDFFNQLKSISEIFE